MSLERRRSPTAVQMFPQGHGSSLLASTRRSLGHSGICPIVLEAPSLGPCQLQQASGGTFRRQENISYFNSISERWLARMTDVSHHPVQTVPQTLSSTGSRLRGLFKEPGTTVCSVEHSHSNQLGHLLSVLSPGTHCLPVTNCHSDSLLG